MIDRKPTHIATKTGVPDRQQLSFGFAEGIIGILFFLFISQVCSYLEDVYFKVNSSICGAFHESLQTK